MKNLTRFSLMVFTFFIACSLESAAFEKSSNLTRNKSEIQLKKNINLEQRCCTEYYIDENDCGTTMYVAATACTEGTTVSMERICQRAHEVAMASFTKACDQEEPTN